MTKEKKYGLSTGMVRLLYVLALAAYFGLMLWLLSGCERRELYVYGDNYRSVELEVNWRKYADRDPDGMTVWFYPLGYEPGRPYRTTTANVRKQELYLPGGIYDGVVIDYSPEEYSRQHFLDLDSLTGARVVATPAAYQPDSMTVTGEGVPAGLSDEVNAILYGEGAWTDKHVDRPSQDSRSGLYLLSNQPESMALDTLSRVAIERGEYGDYIPYKLGESYQSQINVSTLHAEPLSIVWHVRVRVFVAEGFNYLWRTPATITGLSNGHYLASDKNTDEPCIIGIDEWETVRTGENSGYLQATFTTFGLRPGSVKGGTVHHVAAAGDMAPASIGQSRLLRNEGLDGAAHHVSAATRAGYGASSSPNVPLALEEMAEGQGSEPPTAGNWWMAGTRAGESSGWYDYETDLCESDELRLNLVFVLRDHSTILKYQFDVGRQVVSFDEQLVLRLDLDEEYFDPDNPDGGDPIELPYVEAYSGTGFDANVSEWEEGGVADTTM